MSANQDFLRPKEAADILGVKNRTLTNWERKGLLVPVCLPTGHRREMWNEIEALLGYTRPRSGGDRSVI